MKPILQLFAVGLLFAIGQGLRCYKCNVGLWDLCFTSQIECNAGEECYSLVAEAVGFVEVKMKGCAPQDDCNKTNSFSFPMKSNNTLYTMKSKCCITDLCNAAPGLPGASGVGLALATFTALLMTQVMV